MIFEYIEAESIINYLKKNEISEKILKNFNQILYNKVFMFSESNLSPFIFISVHNFLIDHDSNPVVFDFGIHKLLIPKEEYSSYFLSNESEIDSVSVNKIKTNVMNYGITLLNMFTGNKITMKGKELLLPENITLSNDFKIFISKCLTRNHNKRASWDELQNCNFIKENKSDEINKLEKILLIDDEKLKKIFNYLNDKFELIVNYYTKEDFKYNENLSQIEIFVSATLFEMRIINSFFNRNTEIKPFSNQEEISFISINNDREMNKCDLNFVNPVLKDVEIIKINNNKIIKEFLINLQKYIKKVETILINIQSFAKTSSCSGDYNNFIEQIVNSVDSRNPSNMHQYFSLLITKSSKENNKEIKYYQNSLAKYVMDYLVILITIINDSGKKIYFNKDIYFIE